MIKNLIMTALTIANAVLMFELAAKTPTNTHPNLQDAISHCVIELTINRVFHAQIDGNWPQEYGTTAAEVDKFDNGIIAAQKQGVTDWKQYIAAIPTNSLKIP